MLKSGKRQRGYFHPSSRECPPVLRSTCSTEYVPTLANIHTTPTVAHVKGKINSHTTLILLDSGASCSVVAHKYIPTKHVRPTSGIQLINADGRSVSPIGTATVNVSLGNLYVEHSFMVLDELSSTAILGCDFLTKHNLVIDFSQRKAYCSGNPNFQLELQLIRSSGTTCKMLTLDDELPQAIPTTVKDAAFPSHDMPTDVHTDLQKVVSDHKLLFSQQRGKTTITTHVIDTGDAAPVKVPPRPIPFHYAEMVHNQLQEMAREGILRPSM